MATATSVLTNVIREEIAQGIREMRIQLDPVWSEVFTTSMGVTREGLGRDWKFIKTYTTGISGAYEFVGDAVRDGNTITTTSQNTFKQFGAGASWPARGFSTAPAFLQSTIELKEARGNMFVPMQWLQMDQFDSSIGSAFKELVKGAAKKAALAHAIAFYTQSSAEFPVVYDLAASAAASTHTITIDNSDAAKAHGRINMLHNGQLVDIVTTTTVQNTNTEWAVHEVDYLNNTFKIVRISGATNVTLDAGDHLAIVNSVGNQPDGLRGWMQPSDGSGYKVMDSTNGINVDNYPEFGSLIVAETGPLTEKILTKHIGTFDERIGTMCKLDTLVTTHGVTHGYLENEDNLARYERNGRRLEVKGGWADIDYGYHGKAFKWAISSYSERGAVFALKTGDQNIKEYVPPSIPGTGTSTDFSNEVQFVAQVGGSNGIWLHERVSSSITDMLEAPFTRQCQLCPEMPQGIIITGLDETSSN